MAEKLTIENGLFVDFLKKSTMNGDIPQLLLKQEDDGYSIGIVAENVVSCQGILLKKNFIVYGNVGNITIKDTKKFIKLVDDMKGNVIIEKRDNNKIIIFGEKTEIEYVLCSEEYIENTLPKPYDVKYSGEFKLGKDFFIKLSSKAELFGVSSVTLDVKSNILRGSVESTDKYSLKEEVPFKDCNASYSYWLFKLSKYLEDSVIVSFDTDYPIKLVTKNANFTLTYFIAPFVSVKNESSEEKVVGAEEI